MTTRARMKPHARCPLTMAATCGLRLVAPSQLTSQLEMSPRREASPGALDHHTEAALAVLSEQVVQLLVTSAFR